MALSPAKKTRIVANWKTGKYSKNALAKKHKVSPSTIGLIVDEIPKANAELLKQAIEVEEKKSRITRAEEQAIDEEVKRHMRNSKLAESIIDMGLQATAKNMAKVHRDVESTKLDARERTSHQRTVKMAIETAKLATEKPRVEEEELRPLGEGLTFDEISSHVAGLLPD